MMLEQRLDNVVYRLGFANSRPQARQLVRHGHFLVNGKKVDIPSFQLKTGDVIELREKSRNMQVITDSLEAVVRRSMPQWLELEKDKFKGMVKAVPVREDITMPIQENQIVELYSR
jgi:small subunit ribosomal protein S4